MSDRYAVIGRPINHTKSPLIHGLFAEASGQALEYGAIEGTLDDFETQVLRFRRDGGLGMNITAPFKLRAFELADRRSERAQLARAANALKFEDGRIFAENFDGIGLLRDIEENLGEPLRNTRVLMLGAGGAVRGALLPFLQAGPRELVIANRDMAKALTLRNELNHPKLRISRYEELEGLSYDIVVNATSASLTGELPPLPMGVLAETRLAYELAYGKGLTPFLRMAQAQGVARLADGVGMLVEQAAEAFAWWRGGRPETRTVIDRLTIPLE